MTNGDAYTFTVTALSADGNSPPSAPSNALTVGVPPQLVGVPPSAAVVSKPYAYFFTVTGLPAPTLAVNPGTPLPDGLTFDPTTATISGTPTSVGSTFVDISATSPLGQVQNTFTLVVSSADLGTVTPTPTPTATATTTAAPTATPSGTTSPTSSSGRATSAGLANTGMPVETFVVVAAALLLLGTLLVATTRLRRRS